MVWFGKKEPKESWVDEVSRIVVNGPRSRREKTRQQCVSEIENLIKFGDRCSWHTCVSVLKNIFLDNVLADDVQAMVLPLLEQAWSRRWPYEDPNPDMFFDGAFIVRQFIYDLAVAKPHFRENIKPLLAKWNYYTAYPNYYLALVELNEASRKPEITQEGRMQLVEDFYKQHLKPHAERFEPRLVREGRKWFMLSSEMDALFNSNVGTDFVHTRAPGVDLPVQASFLQFMLSHVTCPRSDFAPSVLEVATQTIEGRENISRKAIGFVYQIEKIKEIADRKPELAKAFADYFERPDVMSLDELKDITRANTIGADGQTQLDLPAPPSSKTAGPTGPVLAIS